MRAVGNDGHTVLDNPSATEDTTNLRLKSHSRLRLLDLIDFIADVAVEAEFFIGGCGKLVAA